MEETTISRKGFLGLVGAATVAAAIATNPLGRFFGAKAAAAPFGEHNQHVVRVFHRFGKSVPTVQVDGRQVPEHYFGRTPGGKYTTHLLPFEDFSSMQDLADGLAEGFNQQLFV